MPHLGFVISIILGTFGAIAQIMMAALASTSLINSDLRSITLHTRTAIVSAIVAIPLYP